MAVYKTLGPDDISRIPFNANKQFTFNSSSADTVGFTIETFQYLASALDTFSNASADSKNTLKYYQLDHLFYKNYTRDISNRLGDADYLGGSRLLYDKVNIVSIPSNLYGNKIKPGTFLFSGSTETIIDDSKGNLLISGTNLSNHSIDEREKIFFLGPVKGFKQYDINYDLYNKSNPNPLTYYNKSNVYDDSYYNNIIEYKNISFKKENLCPSLVTEYGGNPDFKGQTNIEDTNWVVNSNITQTPTPQGIKFSTTTSTTATNPNLRTEDITLKPYAKYRLTINVSDIPVNFTNFFMDHPVATGTKYKLFQFSLSSTTLPTPGAYEFDFQYIPGKKETYTSTYLPNRHKFKIKMEFSNANLNNKSIGLRSIDLKEIKEFPTTRFLSNNSITSSIVAPHNETYNFNPGEDFTISFFANPVSASGYIASKSTTKTLIKTPINEKTYTTGSSQPFNVREKNKFPFEIFIDNSQNLTFRKSDGINIPTITAPINTGSLHQTHVVCMSSASVMEIWIDGNKISSTTDTTTGQTENQANLYLGSKGEISNYYTGSLSNFMIFNSPRTENQIKNLISSSNGLPYIGNIFYSNGLATITHPNHLNIAQPFESSSINSTYPNNLGGNLSNVVNTTHFYTDSVGTGAGNVIVETPIKHILDYTTMFKNIHPIYENEYQCTIKADEYNFTHNISTRKIKSDQKPDLANFATGSQFKPYVTTVGLYNEDNELLVVGKLGQPIRMSDETDTTFAIRWDT